jgi:DNA-binding FadR family transcriptional regulator
MAISNQSDFISYLVDGAKSDTDRIPSLQELSKELSISVARLREQLEAARSLGFVEARPKTGIRRLPYSFLPAVRQSLLYAIELDQENFSDFSDLRDHIETAYWDQAARRLTAEDKETLHTLLEQAWKKLRSPQIQIPHHEHRQLHLCIFSRLDNPFVNGLLEAYWDAYEAVGYSRYADYDYLQKVWEYHQKMVDTICCGDFEAGFQALVEHKALIHHRPRSQSLLGSLSTSNQPGVSLQGNDK